MKIILNERIRQIDDGSSIDELRRRLYPQCDTMILNGFPARPDALLSEGDTVTIYSRSVMPDEDEFEAILAARHTPGVHNRVKSATVGLAGLGGLGSTAGVALVRLGIGNLIIADFDIVEPSNLNRQQYFADQIGMKKTEACAANFRRVNSYINLIAHDIVLARDNFAGVFEACDVVLECFDTPDAKRMAYAVARTQMRDTHFVMVSGIAGFQSAEHIRARRIAPNVVLIGDDVSEAQPGSGLMSPRVSVAAGMQANVALNILLGRDPVEGS